MTKIGSKLSKPLMAKSKLLSVLHAFQTELPFEWTEPKCGAYSTIV